MLRAHDIGFRYHNLRPLLEHVSMDVAAGTLWHIAGANGAGKSTLIKILAGLQRADTGTVQLDVARNQVAYLPSENNGHFLKLSAQENLSFWLALNQTSLPTAALEKTLDLWGILMPRFLGAFPVERFSTGMKRRLALCRLTMLRAPIWLLDEPLLGLDAQGVELFRGALTSHLQSGGACAMISHDAAIFRGLPAQTLQLSTQSRGA